MKCALAEGCFNKIFGQMMAMQAEKGNSLWQRVSGEWSHPSRNERKQGILELASPLIGAALSTLTLLFIVWILEFINIAFQSKLLTIFASAAKANLHWVFAFFLASGCIGFASKRHPRFAIWLFPLSTALGASFSAWILSWLAKTIGLLSGIGFLFEAGSFVKSNLLAVFAVFLALGALSLERKAIR